MVHFKFRKIFNRSLRITIKGDLIVAICKVKMNSEEKSHFWGCSACVAEAIALGDLERLKGLLAIDGVRYRDEFWTPSAHITKVVGLDSEINITYDDDEKI